MPAEPSTTPSDEAFLDSVYARIVELVEEGQSPDVERFAAERPHLQDAIADLVALAKEVAVAPADHRPELAGYHILSELGRGGMGTVYLARQERAGGRPVALKILPSHAFLSESARNRFIHEANTLAKLRHPHIVTVHDVIHEHGVSAYAMEWVDGKSLAEVLEHLKRRSDEATERRRESEPEAQAPGSPRHSIPPAGPSTIDIISFLSGATDEQNLPVARAPGSVATFICRIGIAIARALGEVHRAGVLHRDVKPSNILLRRNGTPLLSDFGLVRETDTTAVTQTGHFVGTPAYASPEQLRGDHEATSERSDVYSLGVTLYHALTLRLPFRGSAPGELLSQIEGGKCPTIRRVRPVLPRDLETIVGKAMDVEPAKRYASADDLADDLERLLNLQPIKAKPATLATRMWKAARRNRATLVGTTLGIVLGVGLSVFLAAYMLLLPHLANQYVTSARVRLLNPRFSEFVFADVNQVDIELSWGIRFATIQSDYEAAIQEYDCALRTLWFRKKRAAIGLERDTVATVLDLLMNQGTTKSIPVNLERFAPGTTAILAYWGRNGIRAEVPAAIFLHRTQTDIRLVGLLAYLCGDANLCLRAWQKCGLDMAIESNPLVDAALGQVALVHGDDAAALPRLDRGVRGFPQVGFLCAQLADCAVRRGELNLAERELNRAESQPMVRPALFYTLERVRADFHAARADHSRGDLENALKIYGQYWTKTKAPAMHLHFGALLERTGDFHLASWIYAALIRNHPTVDTYPAHFIRAMNAWHESLDEAGRKLWIDEVSCVLCTPQGRYLRDIYLDVSTTVDPETAFLTSHLMTESCE